MKNRRSYCKLDSWRPNLSLLTASVLFFILFHPGPTLAQSSNSNDSAIRMKSSADTTRKVSGTKITNFGFGGPAIKFSRFNNQFAFMTGGRGACTVNNRYTIGGGGYGIANFIQLPGSGTDTSRYFKMGYGGLELGYIFFPGKKVNIGCSGLFAAGAAFWQSQPKSESAKIFGNGFKILPVLEPSLYGELSLNRFMRLHTGVSYRYVFGDLDYIKGQNIRGFSCYVALLFGKA